MVERGRREVDSIEVFEKEREIEEERGGGRVGLPGNEDDDVLRVAVDEGGAGKKPLKTGFS